MKRTYFAFFIISCFMLTANAFAQDPIAWTKEGSFPSQTSVGNSYRVSYTLTNTLPKPVPLNITGNFNGSAFSISSGCDTILAPKNQPNSSCLVHVQFRPNHSGERFFQLVMHYHHNVVPLPALTTTVTGQGETTPIKGYVTQALPAVAYTGIAYPVTFTYINTGSLPVTPTSVTVSSLSGFVVTGNTCVVPPNSPIAAYTGTCTITGTFTPGTGLIGQQITLSTDYTYTYNSASLSVPLSTITTVQNGTNCHQVDGVARLPLPAQNFEYANSVVEFVFTPYCSAETITVKDKDIVSNFPETTTITVGENQCDNALVTLGHSCSVFVSVVPNVITSDFNLIATATFNPSSPGLNKSVTNTSEIVVAPANQSTTHTLQFVNQCDIDTWYEFTNGGGGSPDPNIATGNTAFQDYLLTKQLDTVPPVTKVLSITEYLNGAIYARTGCDPTTLICDTAQCPVISSTMVCQAGVQPTNPVTKFELNMASSGTDGIYDVSMVNGFNVPGQVQSLAPVSTDSPPGNSPYPFNCGQSGGALIQAPSLTTATDQLGACPWTFTPPSTSPDAPQNYIWVSPGNTTDCTSDASCSGTDVCGMAYTTNTSTGGNTPINRRCGKFLGYWTLADYINYSSSTDWGNPVPSSLYNLYNNYSMGSSLPAGYGNQIPPPPPPPPPPPSPAIYADMYGCIETSTGALLSGYTYPPVTNPLVCGCYNWTNTAVELPYAGAPASCVLQNQDWLNTVYPRIVWVKNACPTAYSYQYDDKSSSFTCNLPSVKTSYQIVFCPGGKRGRPN